MPSQKLHDNGDLYVKVNVKFPEAVDSASVPLLERALPPRPPLENYGTDTQLEEVTLDDADTRSKSGFRSAQAAAGDDAMDEDGDEPRVQCANQ
jgi:DnaJ family protein A protein 2